MAYLVDKVLTRCRYSGDEDDNKESIQRQNKIETIETNIRRSKSL